MDENTKLFESLIRKANQAATDDDWLTASKDYQQAYSIEASPQVNKNYVLSLYKTRQFVKAEKIGMEYPENYLAEVNSFYFFLTILLLNNSYILAHKFIALANPSWQAIAKQRTAEAEQLSRDTTGQTLLSLTRQFRNIAESSLPEQNKLLEKANQLPLKEYLTTAKYLLVNPDTNQFLRVSLLETLKAVDLQESLEFIWLDHQKYQVIANQLPQIEEIEEYQQVMTFVRESFDSRLDAKQIIDSIKLQLRLMYPYLDRVLTDPIAYAKNGFSQQLGIKEVAEPDQQQKFRLIINQIESNLGLVEG